ncbi:hypothetical protein NPIL_284461, partial [Nephila pilipes]
MSPSTNDPLLYNVYAQNAPSPLFTRSIRRKGEDSQERISGACVAEIDFQLRN